MSGFATHSASHQPAGSQQSAPPSALDIVNPQGVNAWDSLLSPAMDDTLISTHEDSDFIDSPSFILDAQPFSSELDSTGAGSEAFSWDTASLSVSHLRPTSLSIDDVHTPTPPSMSTDAQQALPAALTSSFPLMPLESTNYGVYSFG